MLLVKASAKPSTIQGIGLFADERIPKGTIIWKFDPRFDLVFDPGEVEKFPELQRQLFDTYSYVDKNTGKYIYSIDDSRFENHSSVHDNVDSTSDVDIAKRDIEIGEELLSNYRTFDAEEAVSNEAYLNT